MLKLFDSSKTFDNYASRKCAEVFYGGDNFSIVCVDCDMKTFEFADFLLHFKNVHVLKQAAVAKNWTEDNLLDIKPEADALEVGNAVELQETQEVSMDTDEDVDIKLNNGCIEILLQEMPPDTSKEEEEFDAGSSDDYEPASDNDDEEDEEYTPKVLNRARKGKEPLVESKCGECQKTYKSPRELKIHMKRCHNGKYKCSLCSSAFQQERALNSHLKEHSGYACDQCEKVYKSKVALQVHQFNHSGARSFVCDVENCGKAFYNPKTLRSHKRQVHEATQNFICELCGYQTKKKAALVVHNRSHTGERPFKCVVCNKGFASQSLLIEHKPIHSQERPHKCEFCGACFSRPKALYHHKHLHLGVKKFVCKICSRAYAQAAGLAGHMRQHRAEHIMTV